MKCVLLIIFLVENILARSWKIKTVQRNWSKLINDWGNIVAHWEEFQPSEAFFQRFSNSNFPTHHICPAWKAILTIWQNMKARELQKPQFFNWMNLVNWQKRGSATQANIQKKKKKQFPWIGKNWEVQLEQHSIIPIFNLFVNWEKFGSTA